MSLVDRPVCPCGSATPYDDCCGRLHRGAATAASPEELMRSRYSAFALGDATYLWRTWHPRTRPEIEALAPDPTRTWIGLEVLGAEADRVEFVASYSVEGRAGSQRERSRFEQRAGKWFYVDGTSS